MSLGCDIIEIDRIRAVFERLGDRFLNRILSSDEILLFKSRKDSIEFLAGRFAAKEAVSKCIGTGFSKGLVFTDISIMPDECGAPLVYIKGKNTGFEISITHCRQYAMAVCLNV